MKPCQEAFFSPKMNVKNRWSRAVMVPPVSPASAIVHQILWRKPRVEEHRGGEEREPWGTSSHPGREKRQASERKNRKGRFANRPYCEPRRAVVWGMTAGWRRAQLGGRSLALTLSQSFTLRQPASGSSPPAGSARPYCFTSSTRRFLARPSSLSFEATGE
jgi:hypothetical protein